MTEGILSVLNGLVEKGVITKDMLPDVISTYAHLEKEYEQNPLSEMFKHMTEAIDKIATPQSKMSAKEMLLMPIAVNVVKLKNIQPPFPDFFSSLLSFGTKKCSKCGIPNLVGAKFCYMCGASL